MTNAEIDLTVLRRRSSRAATYAWLRKRRPFERRSIREPGERDAYWAVVQGRLAAFDAEARALYRDEKPGALLEPPSDAVLALLG